MSVLALSLVLAFFMRDVVYEAIIAPLAYFAWQMLAVYRAIPQVIKWILLTAFAAVAILWQLIPEVKTSRSVRSTASAPPSPLSVLAGQIRRARASNYLRWQMANRLGRLARKLLVLKGGIRPDSSGPPEVEAYLAAGVDRSFADYAAAKTIFRARRRGTLDLDPRLAVEYLESEWEMRGGTHDQGL
jgi:hypothetical protein